MRVTTKKHTDDTYFRHVREFPLRRLRSAREHARAKGIYLRLSGKSADQGTRDYLDVLANLIVDYEKRSQQTIDSSAVTAAALVHHKLDERAMSVSALARAIGIPQPNLSEMLGGRREWSKAAIRALVQMFHIRAERFLW